MSEGDKTYQYRTPQQGVLQSILRINTESLLFHFDG
jgi:hypothetical protein